MIEFSMSLDTFKELCLLGFKLLAVFGAGGVMAISLVIFCMLEDDKNRKDKK
jgi:hypothetical protein